MNWPGRGAHGASPAGAALYDEKLPEAVVRATPGIAALLDGVRQDRSHAVLDLGNAADSSLRVYGQFARWVRFADLLADTTVPQSFADALSAIPPQPGRPYDLVFGWDILDWIFPEQRPRLIERLAEISAPEARLHVVVEASEKATTHPFHYSLVDVDRVRYEPTGPARPAQRRMLPAEVERLLAPFTVVRAFTVKSGQREYVAVRGGGAPR